jgi:23S rRNA (adenine2503-C2)-methyltransferase
MIDLKGLTQTELEELAVSFGERKFRGAQLFDWLYRKEVTDVSRMTSLSANLRGKLAGGATVNSIRLVEHQQSSVDGTTKFLFELSDGNRIESVLIPPHTAFDPQGNSRVMNEGEQRRLTLCVSTQVGCALDCTFCATASMGILRNLTTGEIVDQLMQVKKFTGKRITNLVYMGMGEPLMNYGRVMKSVAIITTALGIAARRITISTAGWVPAIRQMAEEQQKVKLAISLHSLDDQRRSDLMPINRKFNLDALLDTAVYYYRKLKQRVTFEYILFDGWNDRPEDVTKLIKLSRRLPCKVNIIPFHSIQSVQPTGLAATLRPTPRGRMDEFVERLRRSHVTVFVRSSAGEDIDGACGQLAVKLGPSKSVRGRAASAVRRVIPLRTH